MATTDHKLIQQQLDEAIARLRAAQANLQRAILLYKVTRRDHPYYPLFRVLCKLKLVEWWIP